MFVLANPPNMKIEDKIKQKKFNTLSEKSFVNISHTQSYLSGKLHNALKPYKISPQQFNVLRILRGQHPNPISINNITSRMVDKMSNVSRLVEKLHLKGLIDRKMSKEDKRQVEVVISLMGQELLELLSTEVMNVIEAHNHLTDEEFETLNNLLDKFRIDD